MMKVGLGSVLGAGAAGAYGMQQISNSGPASLWGMLPVGWAPAGTPGATSDVSALQNEIRRLTGMVGDMARNSNRPTVVHLGGRSGWAVLIVPAVTGTAVLYVYCRVTGCSIWDLLYVSRSSLTALKQSVQESMGKVYEETKKLKDELFKSVHNINAKQDKLMGKQEDLKDQQEQLRGKQDEMDNRLRRVDDACYELDSKATHTITHVEKLDTRLQDVHSGVQAANQGIFMLVSAVSEITQKIGLHNSRTAQALTRYIQGGPLWHQPTQLEAGPDLGTLPPAAPTARASSMQPQQQAPQRGLRDIMDSATSAQLPSTNGHPSNGHLGHEGGEDFATGGGATTVGKACIVHEEGPFPSARGSTRSFSMSTGVQGFHGF